MKRSKVLVLMLIASVILNITCFLPYIGGYYDRFKEKIFPTQYFKSNTIDSVVINAVVEASLKMDGSKFETRHPSLGLVPDVKLFLTNGGGNKEQRQNNYAMAYLYAGLSYYALNCNDKEVIDFLLLKSNEFSSNGKLEYELTEVDQVPIGIMYINLYKISRNKEFLDVARSVFDYLNEKRINGSNLISYRAESANQFSDGVGMICPFLMEYFHATQDSTALMMANDNLNEFKKWGCDITTGIPTHGYNKETHIKVGSANWGRGIGWYLLAAAYMPHLDDPLLDKSIELLNYSQFPLSSKQFDSSTALMIEIYKQSRIPNVQRPLDFIKPHITQEGLVMKCSGDTYDLNNYSHFFGPAELTNGLFLILISHFQR